MYRSIELKGNKDYPINRLLCVSTDYDYEWMKRYMRSIYFTQMNIKGFRVMGNFIFAN